MKTNIKNFTQFINENNENNQMKPVLTQDERIDYVSMADMIRFICDNSDMEWNEVCNNVNEWGIIDDGGVGYWSKDNLEEQEEGNAKYWINAFFEAHPWINEMRIVFDD